MEIWIDKDTHDDESSKTPAAKIKNTSNSVDVVGGGNQLLKVESRVIEEGKAQKNESKIA